MRLRFWVHVPQPPRHPFRWGSSVDSLGSFSYLVTELLMYKENRHLSSPLSPPKRHSSACDELLMYKENRHLPSPLSPPKCHSSACDAFVCGPLLHRSSSLIESVNGHFLRDFCSELFKARPLCCSIKGPIIPSSFFHVDFQLSPEFISIHHGNL